MNGKTAKQLRRVSRKSNQPKRELARQWLKLSHKERGKMRPRLTSRAAGK